MYNIEEINKFIKETKENSNFYLNKPVEKIKPKFKIDNLLFFKGFNLITGESDVGKTNLAINIALNRASNGFKVMYWTSSVMVKVIEYRMQEIIKNKYADKINTILNNIFIINNNQYDFKKLLEYANDNLDLFIIDSSSLVHFENIMDEYEEQREYCKLMEKYNDSDCTYLSIHEINKLGILKGNKSQFYRANNYYSIIRNNETHMIEINSDKDIFGYGFIYETYEDMFTLNKEPIQIGWF